MSDMRRRAFITLLGSAAVCPLAARAQQPTLPVIGFLESGSPAEFVERVQAFREGLRKFGYIEGETVSVEYRFAKGKYDELRAMAFDLVGRHVDLLVATGAPSSAQAAQAATRTVPIVFANAGDPVKLGLVETINRPGGNTTGVTFFNSFLGPKRMELVRELVPKASVAGLLVNPHNPNTPSDITSLQTAGRSIGLDLLILNAQSETDFEPAFAAFAQHRVAAIVINNDSFFSAQAGRIVGIATRFAIPTIYYLRSFVVAGGLVSYGSNLIDMYREVGVYAGRILRGVKPADLPVLFPSKFEFVLNLKTAKMLGLDVPPSILLRADEVIE
jgi:putative ABC transport system substrate-binding protein